MFNIVKSKSPATFICLTISSLYAGLEINNTSPGFASLKKSSHDLITMREPGK